MSTGTTECTVDGCDHMARSSKTLICEMHYYRLRRTGQLDLRTERAPLPSSPCTVDGCDRRARSWADDRHVCTMHWKRWKRNGHFEVVHHMSTPRPRREQCIVPDCEKADDGPHGYCKMHKARVDRHGDPTVFIPQAARNFPTRERNWSWTGDDATYSAVHQRVRLRYGSPRLQTCVDCGGRAAQWSYSHEDPNERQSDKGPYSLNIDNYDPRCVSCHKKFDLAYLRATA